jgi:hypothetical protein
MLAKSKLGADVNSILDNELLLFHPQVFLTGHIGEAPFLGDDDLLSTREFVSGTAQSFLNNWCVVVLTTDGHENLSNVHTCGGAIRLAPSTTHTSLKTDESESFIYLCWLKTDNSPIGTSAGQHLIDAEDVEGMYTNSEMEGILAGHFRDVPMSTDTCCF